MEKIVWGEAIEVNGKKPEWLGDYDADMGVVWEDGDKCDLSYASAVSVWEIITHIKLPADHPAYTALAAGFTPWGGDESIPTDHDGGDVLVYDRSYVDGSLVGEGSPYRVQAAPSSFCWGSEPGRGWVKVVGYHKRVEVPLPSFAPEVAAMAEDIVKQCGEFTGRVNASEPPTPEDMIADFYQKFGAVAEDSPRHLRILDALADMDESTVVVKRMTEDEALAMVEAYAVRYYDNELSTAKDVAYAVLTEQGLVMPTTPDTPLAQFIAANPGVVNDENRHWFELALEWGR